MRRFRGVWLTLALSILSAACSQDDEPATAAAIVVKTDLALGQELGSVQVRIYAPDADVSNPAVQPLVSFDPLPSFDIGRPIVLKKGGRQDFLIAVQGLGPANEPIIEHRARAQFVDGQTIVLPVYLRRTCLRQACAGAPGQTCYGQAAGTQCEGTCGPIPLVESAGMVDSATTAALPATWLPKSCSGPSVMCDGGICPAIPDGGADAGLCAPSVPGVGASCNVVKQCGCPTGQACGITFTSDGAPEPACKTPGVKPAGRACDGPSECAPGTICIGADNASFCRKFCETDMDCGGGGVCKDIPGKDKKPTGLRSCWQRCGGHDDCESHCCDELSDGDQVCLPAEACTCLPAGASCSTASQCCGGTCAAGSNGQKVCGGTGSAPSCPAASTDTACTTCSKQQCCAEYSACSQSQDCVKYAQCLNACTSDACETQCGKDFAAGAAVAARFQQCARTSCASACSGSSSSGGSSGASCAAQSGDSACMTCDKANCCASRAACVGNAECIALNTCFGNCTTDACYEQCKTAHPTGVAPHQTWSLCVDRACPTQCSGSSLLIPARNALWGL